MIWHDILVDRRPDDPEIARALAAAFGVELRSVLVHRDADDFPDPTGYRVIGVATGLDGEYPLLLSVYVYPDGADPPDPTEGARRFSSACNAECLISDDAGDPYTMLRVSPTGSIEFVAIDPARLDELGEYHVVGPEMNRGIAIDRKVDVPLR